MKHTICTKQVVGAKYKAMIFRMLFIILSSNFVSAQSNLVSNGEFENAFCPNGLTQISQASPWDSYCITPDLFSRCATSTLVSVPKNFVGYQAPFSGDNYASLMVFDSLTPAIEVIGAKLNATLTIGRRYFASMKVSMAEYWYDTIAYFVPISHLGMRFSTIPYSSNNCAPKNNWAHIYTTNIISDTTNWSVVQGSFIADSAYQYINIGNFFSRYISSRGLRPNGFKSYYYIDDVKLSESDSVLVSVNSNSNLRTNSFKVWPIPANESVMLDLQEVTTLSNCTFEIVDMLGSKLAVLDWKGESIEVKLHEYPPGLLFCRLLVDGNQVAMKKIIR